LNYFIGLDPGKKGGAAVLSAKGRVEGYLSFFTSTEHEIGMFLRPWKEKGAIAMLEKVHSMPKQGVRSMFTFGQGYGFLRGVMVGIDLKFYEVRSQVWMKKLNCFTGGQKHITREKAQQLFPEMKKDITDSIADALLIAEYGRSFWEE